MYAVEQLNFAHDSGGAMKSETLQACVMCGKVEEEPTLLIELVQRTLNQFDLKPALEDDFPQSAA